MHEYIINNKCTEDTCMLKLVTMITSFKSNTIEK